VFRPKVLRENHGGGGGGRGGGGHRGGRGLGGGHRGWGGGWGGGSYAVNPLYIYDDYNDDVYYSYPYYYF